ANLLQSKLSRLVVMGLLAVCLGCSNDSSGPERYTVSGTVTRGRQPLPAGSIIFEPDASAQNSGPTGSASIVEGKFETPEGQGTIGGPHIVRILPPAVESGSTVAPGSQFQPYETKIDLPKEDS